MNTLSQVSKKESNIQPLDLSGIDFIFFKPFSEYYYQYSINGVDNSHLIERLEISRLFENIYLEINIHTMRFKSFLIFTKPIKVVELLGNDEDITEAIAQNLKDEMALKAEGKIESPLREKVTSLFSKVREKNKSFLNLFKNNTF